MASTCIVATSQRCDAPTDGPHSRVRFARGQWERWLSIGAWVTSARVEPKAAAPRVPSLAELAASVPRMAPVAVMPGDAGGAR